MVAALKNSVTIATLPLSVMEEAVALLMLKGVDSRRLFYFCSLVRLRVETTAQALAEGSGMRKNQSVMVSTENEKLLVHEKPKEISGHSVVESGP